MQGIPLAGGQMTTVVKIDNTVHRTVGEWTPAVHQLLQHLEAVGFQGVPRVLGMDAEGREILSFVDGDAGYFDATRTVPVNLWSDDVLVAAAAFLRRYHDATVGFVAQPGTHWQLSHPDLEWHEVICHNDFAPWNSVFVDGTFHGIIDFDTAGPGPRIDDIAYAAYSFAPLFRPEKCPSVGLQTPPDYGHKLKLFCDAYGGEYCGDIVEAIITCIQATCDWVVAQAQKGDQRFRGKIKEGHVANYQADIAFLRAHQDEFQNSLR